MFAFFKYATCNISFLPDLNKAHRQLGNRRAAVPNRRRNCTTGTGHGTQQHHGGRDAQRGGGGPQKKILALNSCGGPQLNVECRSSRSCRMGYLFLENVYIYISNYLIHQFLLMEVDWFFLYLLLSGSKQFKSRALNAFRLLWRDQLLKQLYT